MVNERSVRKAIVTAFCFTYPYSNPDEIACLTCSRAARSLSPEYSNSRCSFGWPLLATAYAWYMSIILP